MKFDSSGTWFICTISKQSANNWEICKDTGLWGIAASFGKPALGRSKPGDHLVFYKSGVGLVGLGRTTAPMKRPLSREEVPWPGGLYRYGALLPFKLEIDLKEPVKIEFEDRFMKRTTIHGSRLQKGFSAISNEDGMYLRSLMVGRKK